jgi:hypothetical protein
LEPGVTLLQWLQKAESRGLDIVAITDHNTVDGVARLRAEIERLTWLEMTDRLRPEERRDLDEYRRLGERLLVLPGFEFTATFGFHVLAIFPSETSIRALELLLLRLNVPEAKLTEGSTEVGATADVLTAYRLVREAGGLVIAAHVNSTHGVAMRGVNFGGQTKIAFTQDPNLHALEVTDMGSKSRRSTAKFFDGSKPEYPRRMHILQGSDAHRLTHDPKDKNRLGIGERVAEICLPEVSFEALRMVLESDDYTRIRPYAPASVEPFDLVQTARDEGNTIVQAFHESMVQQVGRLGKILGDVVAFANTRGGTIYIGASASRRGQPRGVENADQAVGLLKREIERNITPLLDARVDVVQSQGAAILRIVVPDGVEKPYALGQTRIYVRQEGDTNEAVRDEIVSLVLSQFGPDAGRPAKAPLQAPPVASDGDGLNGAGVVEATGDTESDGQLPVGTLPGIGVEVLKIEDRKGTRYYSIRDLRNGNVIHNVSKSSARKLWSYAIQQHTSNPVNIDKVAWNGDLGLWQVARRAKRLRYDLVLRAPAGDCRVFYGVTADGMSGPWQQFLQGEDRTE